MCVSPGPHQYLFTSNSNPNGNAPGTWDTSGEIYKMELDGTILGRFGHASKQLGGFQVVHMMDCRNPNEILVAEIESWRVQKLLLKPARDGTSQGRFQMTRLICPQSSSSLRCQGWIADLRPRDCFRFGSESAELSRRHHAR